MPRHECSRCKGSGQIVCVSCDGNGNKYVELSKSHYICNQCSGTGTLQCPRCYGKGWVNS